MLKTALMLLLLLLLQRRVSYMLCDTQTQVRWRQDGSMPSCEGGFNEMIESNRLVSNRPPPYGGMAQIVRDRCDKYVRATVRCTHTLLDLKARCQTGTGIVMRHGQPAILLLSCLATLLQARCVRHRDGHARHHKLKKRHWYVGNNQDSGQIRKYP